MTQEAVTVGLEFGKEHFCKYTQWAATVHDRPRSPKQLAPVRCNNNRRRAVRYRQQPFQARRGLWGGGNASLPDISDFVGRLGASTSFDLSGRHVSLTASARYVRRSRLGVGSVLDLHQGRYVDTAIGASVPIGRATLSLDATNLLDAKDNIFALGNPFGVLAARQVTPQRPRTIRLGATMRF